VARQPEPRKEAERKPSVFVRAPLAVARKIGRLGRMVVRLAVLGAVLSLVLVILDALLLKDVERRRPTPPL